jgi:hypothetical protein
MITDLLPYYLANTTGSGKDGRSMADNVEAFERANPAAKTGVERRPEPEALLRHAAALPGNVERLADIFGHFEPRLLLTLGVEAAAFVRGMTFASASEQVDALLYAEPVRVTAFGRDLQVVHLVHPHLFIKQNEKWMGQHRKWCGERGRGVVARIAAGG